MRRNANWNNPTDLLKDVPEMMDEYAKVASIGFAEWIADNSCKRLKDGLWLPLSGPNLTTSELYSKYIEYLNK